MPAISSPSFASPDPIRPLSRDELPLDTVELARFLLGKTLIHATGEGLLSGRIVETEGYVVGDSANHAFRGETKRNRSMFLQRGHAYVYIAYGCWPVLNVTSEESGVGTAVLLRALEPLEGVDAMHRHRATERLHDVARGPGRLAAAMRVTLAHDGLDLCGDGALWLGAAVRPPKEVVSAPRIGITRDAERPLRFFERGNSFVSGPRRLLGG